MNKQRKSGGVDLFKAECMVCGTHLRPLYVVYYRGMSGNQSYGGTICGRCAKSWTKAAKSVHWQDDRSVYTWNILPKKGKKKGKKKR